MSGFGWMSTRTRRSSGFWVWKMRRKMATRLSPPAGAKSAPERRERRPEPSAAEWRALYDWDREINRRIVDGSIHDLPPVEEQLAEHIARLGL